jgi:hypothetical protein
VHEATTDQAGVAVPVRGLAVSRTRPVPPATTGHTTGEDTPPCPRLTCEEPYPSEPAPAHPRHPQAIPATESALGAWVSGGPANQPAAGNPATSRPTKPPKQPPAGKARRPEQPASRLSIRLGPTDARMAPCGN